MHATASPERVHAAALPRDAAPVREPAAGASARPRARTAGGLWLAVIVTGMFAFLVQSPLIVRGDPAATAANITSSETMFRLGLAANLAAGICYLGVTVLLYTLLKPVGRSLSLLAAACGLVGVAVGAAGSLAQLSVLAVLSAASAGGAFTAAQLQALAYTFTRVDAQAFQLGMLYFGVQCALLGYLVTRSTFLPRLLGVLLGVGGLSYVASSLANLVAPAFGAALAPFVIPAALVGEGSLTAWLIAKGVDGGRWQEQAVRQ